MHKLVEAMADMREQETPAIVEEPFGRMPWFLPKKR